ncbi:MAG: M20/M25/M40 family metallo-hydrolase [Anaerolineae bacterium]|nr:M20/M25/M40 family metallo-hydrolase [Anaerolineae bacterium]
MAMQTKRRPVWVVFVVIVLMGGMAPTFAVEDAPGGPFDLISQESLFAFLEDLTAIEPYSGWRNSATVGEAAGLDYVAGTLGGYGYLQELGLALERQTFNVFLATELWETRLDLTLDGASVEVPADGLRGPRDEIGQALRFDSDGALNDSDSDPAVVEGPVVVVRSVGEIDALRPADVQGKVVFLDYATIDRVLFGMDTAVRNAWRLIDNGPAGLVVVTQFSNAPGESHGAFIGDVSALNHVESANTPPTLYVRLEDLAPFGVAGWDDLAKIESARLTWDADVFSPGESGNLVARIPGVDSARAVILGAHIDSPNAPGAMDDASGSAVLLEVARVLDEAQVQPPVDLYLAWFGSEELGLYGSAHFAATHQDLLDRALAMLEIDCLTYPLDGLDAEITLVTWSYGRLGNNDTRWTSYLSTSAGALGIAVAPRDVFYIYSDNSVLNGFDVPNANLIYEDEPAMDAVGGFHYAAQVHAPYDTVELARGVGDVFEQMAHVALAAALQTGQDAPALRVAPQPDRRALFVAGHTESIHMMPAAFIDFAMALAWEGFDVDLIPYGQPVTAADLEDADLVVALPVVDYPGAEAGNLDQYDEAWRADEIAALEAYVDAGGVLALTNSANRLKFGNRMLDPNEDWEDANALAEVFGVSYYGGPVSAGQAAARGDHPLVEGVRAVELVGGNAIPFTLEDGWVLAEFNGALLAGVVDYGQGHVVALGDVGMLGAAWEPQNLRLWQNLARFAR